MKILHVSAGNTGGARLASERLANAQINAGHHVLVAPTGPLMSKKLKYFSKTITFAQKTIVSHPYEFMSTFSLETQSINEIERFEPDVVHVHNWYNQLSLDSIRKLGHRFPIIFTLHDQRLTTGGCHYSYDCKQFLDNCSHCPAVRIGKNFVKANKVNITHLWDELNQYGIISPSHWLHLNSNDMPIFQEAHAVAVIPNIINDIFYKQNPRSSPNTVTKIVFIASNADEEIKGLKILLGALHELFDTGFIQRDEIQLTVVGECNEKRKEDSYINYLGTVSSSEAARIFRNSDLCVVPSLLDNLPSVIPEAQLSKLFVIASAVGGIPELIEDSKTGLLCEPNTQSLSDCIRRFIAFSDYDKRRILDTAYNFAIERYNSVNIVHQHDDVYKKIISARENGSKL